MSTILVVTEAALGATDIANLRILAEGTESPEDARLEVLVPTGQRRNVFVEFLDQLALLNFSEAFESVSRHEDGPETEEARGGTILEESLAALREAGFRAEGHTAPGDPLASIRAAVEDGAEQVVIITDPHPVEDTLNIHWANEAEKTLGVPVLHLIWGTERVDD